MTRLFDKTAPQNVHGWERTASLAGGLMLVGKGLRRGGLGGMIQLAMGGMALARGISGRCEAKRILSETGTNHGATLSTTQQRATEKQRYAHMPLDSEVHSPDFEQPQVTLPDTTPMGHETHAGRP
ncbi:YgaP family membrane protein [Stutzerimonas chloritidismutans]|uniref:YgaP family membrane protein n=1 Tax=Stutzerimonas chloritidismutans TaxID=203192 RepID=UPI003F1552B1